MLMGNSLNLSGYNMLMADSGKCPDHEFQCRCQELCAEFRLCMKWFKFQRVPNAQTSYIIKDVFH